MDILIGTLVGAFIGIVLALLIADFRRMGGAADLLFRLRIQLGLLRVLVVDLCKRWTRPAAWTWFWSDTLDLWTIDLCSHRAYAMTYVNEVPMKKPVTYRQYWRMYVLNKE